MALRENYWTSQVDILQGITVEHIFEFVNLWERLSHVHLNVDTPDTVTSKFTTGGHYSVLVNPDKPLLA